MILSYLKKKHRDVLEALENLFDTKEKKEKFERESIAKWKVKFEEGKLLEIGYCTNCGFFYIY